MSLHLSPAFAAAAVVSASVLMAAPQAAIAQVAVHDPANYAQNLLQAARALQSVNNQIQSLQNEALALANQARDLTSLPVSSLATLQAQMERTRQLMREAEGLAYDVADIENAFEARYRTADLSISDQALINRAETRWQASVSGLEDALKVQAVVVEGFDQTQIERDRLVAASQGAVGALQVTQAGNQLLALQAGQLADLSALIAAQGRAQALEAADRAAVRADARARFNRFMGSAAPAPENRQ
ncbi:P-type conjugative transfer protein TrbJ [Brevundimonas sp. 1080]|uniref:P-type conjugative transfer protein TrbJ n=1 Tax=Brevundimonas sp. 1080 TaxID=3156405 RepID=UPI003395288D